MEGREGIMIIFWPHLSHLLPWYWLVHWISVHIQSRPYPCVLNALCRLINSVAKGFSVIEVVVEVWGTIFFRVKNYCGLTWSSPRSDPRGRLTDPEAVLLGGSGNSVLVGIWPPPPPLLLIQTEEPPEATPDSLLLRSRWYEDIFRIRTAFTKYSKCFTLLC